MAALHHVRQGTGEPLVLVHGLGSHWQMWTPVLDRLSRERDVVAVDLPGFGASAPLDCEPTVEALAGALGGLIDELGLERPHLAGNSLGGGIALELARAGRARSATALSPIGFARGRERPYLDLSLQATRLLAGTLRPALPAITATPVGRTALAGQLIGRPWRVPADQLTADVEALLDAPGFDDTRPPTVAWTWDGGDLDVPVTIAWGEHDWLLIPRQGRRARRLMPKARHVWLAGCGHVPTWDDPEQVATVLLAGSRD